MSVIKLGHGSQGSFIDASAAIIRWKSTSYVDVAVASQYDFAVREKQDPSSVQNSYPAGSLLEK